MASEETTAKEMLQRAFGRDLAEAHAARRLDAAPELVYRIKSEYDPHERGLRYGANQGR